MTEFIKPKRNEWKERDPNDPNRHKCAIPSCPLPGTLSPATVGSDKPFYCKHHFWNLKDDGKARRRSDPELAADYLQDMRDRLGVYRQEVADAAD